MEIFHFYLLLLWQKTAMAETSKYSFIEQDILSPVDRVGIIDI